MFEEKEVRLCTSVQSMILQQLHHCIRTELARMGRPGMPGAQQSQRGAQVLSAQLAPLECMRQDVCGCAC